MKLTSTAIGLALILPSAAFAQAAQDTPPAAEKTEATQLNAVTVTGERGYKADTSSAGSKTDLPIKDIPQSVTVIDQELLKDLDPRVLDEVADYVAGVSREAVQSNPYAISFFFRGFNTAGAAASYDGFRESGFETPQSGINIERIEFLKGPASVLYGGSYALSGLVNIVSKQPLATAHRELTVGGGSFDHLYATFDGTGPLLGDPSLRYRLTAAYDKDGDFVYGTHDQSLFISPYLSWDLDSATRIDLELVDQEIKRPGRENGFERYPAFFDLPVRTQLGDPGTPAGAGGDLSRRIVHAELVHTFGDNLKLREGLFAQTVLSDDTTIQVIGFDPATDIASRHVRAVNANARDRSSQTELSGDQTIGSLRQQWIAGMEVSRDLSHVVFLTSDGTDADGNPTTGYTPINIFDPTYPGTQSHGLSGSPPGTSGSRTLGFYAQDLISLPAHFKLSLGVRYDDLHSFSKVDDASSPETDQKDTAYSPRAGLIWQPRDSMSYYASWTRSFAPNVGLSQSGGVFAPEHGTQYEVGGKFDLVRGLSLTTALFNYKLRNVLAPDPNDPTDTYSITVGEQRSRGFEAELTGRVMRDWNVVASYTYLDAIVTKDTVLPVGDRLGGVPRNELGLFNKVGLRAVGVPDLSATAGISYASKRESGLPNDPDGDGPLTAADVRLPAYVDVAAGLIYERTSYTLRLNGRNLTDKKIYDGYYSTFQPRAPRSVDASVAVRF